MVAAEKPAPALIGEAEKAYRSGRYADAAALYEQAASACLKVGDMLQAAEQENNRSVALLLSGDARGASAAAERAGEAFHKAGDGIRYGLALGNQAAALEALAKRKEALAAFQKSADVLKQNGDRKYRGHVLKKIATLQLRSGRVIEALASMHAAYLYQQKLGPVEWVLKKLLDLVFRMFGRSR